MKNILLALVFAASTILGGCANTTPGGGGTATDYTALVAQIQGYTKTACGFVPTAATILNILGAAVPGVTAATAIAQAVCTAVAPPMMAGRGTGVSKTVKGWHVTPGEVNGVVVEGSKS